MSEWFSGDVIANGVRLHYYRTGGDKPPLVLCHGFGDSAPTWFHVARDLEADYDIIMYDARGHGRSGAPETGYDFAAHAADLVGLIQALELERPRVWGHSMGAMTAALAAAEKPDLMSCLVLEDPGWKDITDPEQEKQMLAAMLEQQRASYAEWQSTTREALLARYKERFPTWHEESLAPIVDSRQQLHLQAQSLIPALKQPWRELVARIACPILLLVGNPQLGGMVTPAVAAEVESLWREGRVVTVPDAGHQIHRVKFPAMKAELQAFLSEVDRRNDDKPASPYAMEAGSISTLSPLSAEALAASNTAIVPSA